MTWWLLTIAGVLGCGLFAGLETGVYSLNRVRLHLLAHKPHSRAAVLAALLAHPARLLASLLIATNLATNLATSSLAYILHEHGLSEWQVIMVDVLIMTPVFFIFAETLPKDLFAVYADQLVYPFARMLRLLNDLFRAIGLLTLIMGVSHLVTRLIGAHKDNEVFGPRWQVHLLVREGVGHGLLSDEQSVIVQRVMALEDRQVRDEMVVFSKVITVGIDDDPQIIWDLCSRGGRSRLPVVDSQGKVTGVLHVMDALLHPPGECPSIRQLQRPSLTMDARTPLRAALRWLQDSREPLAVVTADDTPIGIVTVKDLVETITGELTSW